MRAGPEGTTAVVGCGGGGSGLPRRPAVTGIFLLDLLVLFGTEEPWEHICSGQGAEGAKPRGMPNAGLLPLMSGIMNNDCC